MNWLKENKKKLIMAGVSLAAIVAAILACRNIEELEEVFKSLEKIVEQASEKISMTENVEKQSVQQDSTVDEFEDEGTSETRAAHDVREHIRNLHEGWNASEEKKAIAAERGIELQPGQTLVDAYSTGSC